MPLPRELTARRDERHGWRLGDIIRRLSSDKDGERVAAVDALDRVLGSAGCDFHVLADHLESNGGGTSKADMRKIFDAGYEQGVQDAENKLHGTNDFCNADGKPQWEAVALYLQRSRARLDSKHHQFVDDMASR